jgi:catechol 2,3-dioxygenase-like lactoylglutathione lyase family enzyme
MPTKNKTTERPVRQQPETLRLRTGSPIYTVNDVEQSLRWYRDVLGCAVGERWEEGGRLQGVEMLAGGVSFFLNQDDWKKGRDRAKGEGVRVYCTTVQDVDGLASSLKARGVKLEHEPHDEMGVRAFALADPDGYKITIGGVAKK